MNLFAIGLILTGIFSGPLVEAQAISPNSLDPNDPRCIEVEFGLCTKASLEAGGLLQQVKTCEDAVTQAAIIYDNSLQNEAQDTTAFGSSLNNLIHGYAAYRGAKFAAGRMSSIPRTVEQLEREKRRLANMEKFYENARTKVTDAGKNRAVAQRLGQVKMNLAQVSEKLTKIADLRIRFPSERTIDGLLAKAVSNEPTLHEVQSEIRSRLARLEKINNRLTGNKKLMSIRSKTIAALRSEIRVLKNADNAVTRMIEAPARGLSKKLWNAFRYVSTRSEALFTTAGFLSSQEELTVTKYMRKSLMKKTLGRAAGAIVGGVIGAVIGEVFMPDAIEAPGSEHIKEYYTQSPARMFEALKGGTLRAAQICNFATDPLFADELDQIMALVSDYGLSSGKIKDPLPQLSNLLAGAPVKDPGSMIFSSEFDDEESAGRAIGSSGAGSE